MIGSTINQYRQRISVLCPRRCPVFG